MNLFFFLLLHFPLFGTASIKQASIIFFHIHHTGCCSILDLGQNMVIGIGNTDGNTFQVSDLYLLL